MPDLPLLQRLKQRKIVQRGLAYLAGAFVVFQGVEVMAEPWGISPGVQRGIHIVLLIGLFITLVLAWYHGEKGRQRVSGPELLMVAALLVVAGVALSILGGPEDSPGFALSRDGDDRPGVAVLPCTNMSADPNDEYLAKSLHDEILLKLQKISSLFSIGRTSVLRYAEDPPATQQIAAELGVGFVGECSVQKYGNQIRLIFQLLDGETGGQVWAEAFDQILTSTNLFEILRQIAQEVALALNTELTPAEQARISAVPTENTEAYQLYLQARHLGHQFTAESVEQSDALYERALEIDPDYAAAWAGLANNYSDQARYGQRPIDEGFRMAREAANRALAIDPENAEAFALLGLIAMNHDRDLATAARHIERAMELDPTNPDIVSEAAMMARNLGRADEAVALAEYVVARDPVNPTAHLVLGYLYGLDGRLDEAVTSRRTALTLSPGTIGAQYLLGVALLLKDEPEAALAAFAEEADEGYRLIGLPMAYHALGQSAESDVALGELIDDYEEDSAFNIAYVLAFRGEADRAFQWLDKAVEYNDPGLADILPGSILFANIHDDPRWLPFLESIGKSPEQLAAIEFEVRLPRDDVGSP
jgi:TolB-like protein/lipopolysaccharide biosynthesis regulator YciM